MENKPKPRTLIISDDDWTWLTEKANEQDRSVAYYVRQMIKKEREGNGNERA